MPFYEYQCKSCGHDLEAMQKINDAPLKKCPSCGKSQLQRLMSAPVFRLKGAGWYETDFKGDADNKKNLADRPEAEAAKDEKAPAVDAKAKDDAKDSAKDSAKESGKDSAKDSPKESGKEGAAPKDKAADKPAEKAAATAAAPAKKPGAERATSPMSKRGVSAAPSRLKPAVSKATKKPAVKAKKRR